MAETVKHETVLDPGQQQLATVYAKALLGAAIAAGNAEQVLEELDSFVLDVLDRLPTLEASLAEFSASLATRTDDAPEHETS